MRPICSPVHHRLQRYPSLCSTNSASTNEQALGYPRLCSNNTASTDEQALGYPRLCSTNSASTDEQALSYPRLCSTSSAFTNEQALGYPRLCSNNASTDGQALGYPRLCPQSDNKQNNINADSTTPTSNSNNNNSDTTFMKAINAQIDNHMSKLLDGDREFILDTGASFHLGCPSKLTNDERLSIHSVPSQQVQTANGTVSTNQMATVFVKILEINVEVYLMDHCPWLLSIGMLCQQCDFVWRRGQNPLIGIYDQGMSDQPKFVELPVYANIPRCTVAKGKSLPSNEIGGDPWAVQTHSSLSDSSSSPPNASETVKPPEVPSSPSGAPSGDTKPEVSEAADEGKWEKVRSKRSRRRKCDPTCKKANTLSDHNIFAHNPKHPSCPICTGAKMQNAQNRRSCKKADIRTNEEKMP